MKRLMLLLVVLFVQLTFADDLVKADEDGWTNLSFLDGMVQFRAPFDLEEVEVLDVPKFIANAKGQIETSFFLGRNDKVVCSIAIFNVGRDKLELDPSYRSELKYVKCSTRTAKKGGWACLSSEIVQKDGRLINLRIFIGEHKVVLVAIGCEDSKDEEAKKIKKQILDSFVFDEDAEDRAIQETNQENRTSK